METPVIRYNIKETGRVHTGQSRNFNVSRLYSAINSAETQEKVSNGDMLGYLGHMPRIRYGMTPTETVIDGKVHVPVEPAFVTTYLKMDDAGNVEHKARFIDNQAGKTAHALWNDKVGGFSSAIDQQRNVFYGFDYVHAPNFIKNSFRGVVLDSCTQDNPLGLTVVDVNDAMYEEQMAAFYEYSQKMNERFAELDSSNKALLDMLVRVQQENAALLDSIVSGSAHNSTYKRPEPSKKAKEAFDSAAKFLSAEIPMTREAPKIEKPRFEKDTEFLMKYFG